ncbi:MAG: HAMP domain-containing protein [Deltaproteobacteria bacterium]|nr:HAMP domain-containing protein [Deltaproteobacteria bacterium]
MRKARSLFWQLYPLFVVITILAIVTITLYAAREIKLFHLKQTAADLEARAIIFSDNLTGWDFTINPSKADALCKQIGRRASTRFTIILSDGSVIGDTDEEPARMDNHGTRPEVIQALKGKMGLKTRKSDTFNQRMMYVALPILYEGRVRAVVRTSLPITSIDQRLNGLYLRVLFSGLAVSLIVAVISLFLSRRISRPLVELKKGAERFARGELESKIHVEASEEINSLGRTMNAMASQLHDRIQSVVRESREKEAILSSMVEAVFTVNMEEKITSLNQAAAQLLDTAPDRAEGFFVNEVFRNLSLQNFIQQTLATEESIEGNIDLAGKENQFLQAHGTVLRDQNGHRTGALIVLNDITNLRRLENIRREFVANVSHEIKTPITSIMGSAETLLSGGVEKSEDVKRFLEIINRQSNRLVSIVDDLLELSHLEQESEKREIPLSMEVLHTVLKEAVQICEIRALWKKIQIELIAPTGLKARINPPLFEQAVLNLLDNAIKYSPDQGTIRVEAAESDDGIIVSIQDPGETPAPPV